MFNLLPLGLLIAGKVGRLARAMLQMVGWSVVGMDYNGSGCLMQSIHKQIVYLGCTQEQEQRRGCFLITLVQGSGEWDKCLESMILQL